MKFSHELVMQCDSTTLEPNTFQSQYFERSEPKWLVKWIDDSINQLSDLALWLKVNNGASFHSLDLNIADIFLLGNYVTDFKSEVGDITSSVNIMLNTLDQLPANQILYIYSHSQSTI